MSSLPADVLKEHRLEQKVLERKMTQDREDLKIAFQLASQEADEAKVKNPLLCQFSAMEKIKKPKNEDLKFCKEKLNFRKYNSNIIGCLIFGQQATK